MQEIVIVYLLLYVCLRITRRYSTISFVGAIVIFITILILQKFGTHWYIGTLSIVSSIVICKYRQLLLRLVERQYIYVYAIIGTVFIALYLFHIQHPFKFTILAQNLLFPLVIVLPLYNKTIIMDRILGKISQLTLEIFLMQGFVFIILNANGSIFGLSYVMISWICTIILSFAMKPIFDRLLAICSIKKQSLH